MRFALVAAIAVGLVTLAACGGDDEATTSETPTESPAATTAPPITVPPSPNPSDVSGFVGTFNGVRLFPPNTPSGEGRHGVCASFDEWEVADPSIATGTPMEISPRYLPDLPLKEATPEPDNPATIVCKGQVDSNRRTYDVDDQTGRFLVIAKTAGEHAVGPISVSERRLEATTVGGKPAVLVHPISDDPVFGDYGSVLVAEDYGMIVVSGLRIPIEELVKVAEGVQ